VAVKPRACLPALLLTLLPGLAVAQDKPAVREVGALVYDGVPELPRSEVARAGQFLNVRNAVLAGWTADGAMLVTTVFGDTVQAHRVAAPGSYRQQLTFFD
jgi:hypothetical protein